MGFLKNHRKLLTHMAERGAIELEQAESAFQQACSDFEQVITLENSTRLRKAADWVRYRSQNVDIVALKWRRLDEEHVYILTDHGEAVPLTDWENKLNITIRQKLATASVANAPPPPKGSPASPPQESPAAPPKESPPHRHQELGEEVLPAERDGQEWREESDSPEWPGSASVSRSRGPVPPRSPVPPWHQVHDAMPEPPRQKAQPLLSRMPAARRSAVAARQEARGRSPRQEGSERSTSRPRPYWNDV